MRKKYTYKSVTFNYDLVLKFIKKDLLNTKSNKLYVSMVLLCLPDYDVRVLRILSHIKKNVNFSKESSLANSKCKKIICSYNVNLDNVQQVTKTLYNEYKKYEIKENY